MPRPTKPFFAPWLGKHISGFCHLPDGRWRIVSTGERFRETDERAAVAKFYKMTGQADQAMPTVVVGEVVARSQGVRNRIDTDAMGRQYEVAGAMGYRTGWAVGETDAQGATELIAGLPVHEPTLWNWFGRQLRQRPEYVARMTGIPQLAALYEIEIQKPITLKAMSENYEKHNGASEHTKRQVIRLWERLTAHTKAATLADLTTERLMTFREHIEGTVDGANARTGYYGKLKAVISFGLKTGMDARQIGDALTRFKVLWTAEPLPPVNPKPITREQFHKLLTAGDGTWRPWLLLGLNLCMSMDEVCGLRWEWFDLKAGTFACIRQKTKRKRIPRAAVLWSETIVELQKLDRKGPYVLRSKYGTRFTRNYRVDEFREFAKSAGVDVTFSSLRDGAYTMAVRGAEEKWARVLAGHRAAGLQDNYVLRTPESVKPASAAVWAAYFGPDHSVKTS